MPLNKFCRDKEKTRGRVFTFDMFRYLVKNEDLTPFLSSKPHFLNREVGFCCFGRIKKTGAPKSEGADVYSWGC